MKWREVQDPPSSPVLAPGPTPANLSPDREREKDTNPMPDTDEKRLSQQTVEATSPGSATSTPKPSSRNSLAHVLIVDDNDINVKV
jgi:hypothetical protein